MVISKEVSWPNKRGVVKRTTNSVAGSTCITLSAWSMSDSDSSASEREDTGPLEYVVEAIRVAKLRREHKKLMAYYKVKWEGYSEAACTYEPIDNLDCLSIFEDFVEQYRQEHEERKSRRLEDTDSVSNQQASSRTGSGDEEADSEEEMAAEESNIEANGSNREKHEARQQESAEKEQEESDVPAAESPSSSQDANKLVKSDDSNDSDEFKSFEDEKEGSQDVQMTDVANCSPEESNSANEDSDINVQEQEYEEEQQEDSSSERALQKKNKEPGAPSHAPSSFDVETLRADQERDEDFENEWCRESFHAPAEKASIPNRLIDTLTAPIEPPKRMFEWKIRYMNSSAKKRKLSDGEAEDTDRLAELSFAASKLPLTAISDKLASNGLSTRGDEVFVRRRWLASQFAQVEDYDVADIKTHFLTSEHTYTDKERRSTFMLDNEHECLIQVDQLDKASSVRRHKAGRGSIRHVILRLMVAVEKNELKHLTSIAKEELISLRLYMSAVELDEWALRDALIHTPNLEILELNTSFKALSFIGVKSIISLLPKLRELDLWGQDLSDQAVRFIADHCPYLECLVLSGSFLAEETIRLVATQCPFIRVLCLDFVPHLSSATLKHLLSSLPQLKLLLLRNAGSDDSSDTRARVKQLAKSQNKVIVVM